MKNYLKYMFFLVLVVGCQNIPKAPKPDRLIPEDKMVDILVDLAKIDASMSFNPRSFKKRGIDPEAYIYEKYGIDSAQLAKNNAYYIEQFEINKRMYEAVRERLKNQKEILDSIDSAEDKIRTLDREAKKRSNDSLLKNTDQNAGR